ncbi:flagellar export chaperone FliS [Rhodothermus profundi]|uniref:Flagellar protein FliS n=1 Tax=Rhodothermus profundi TaxID=633813 RepID=A0A1M6X812_9BACT|nr:flagellar export chaperone FliS [Rhodothermus profundi]SHL02056.1 flagellar protein FliS [Rhodothermus profundi]
MSTLHYMRQYQEQAVLSASPAQLILKLYDLGIAACKRGDRAKVRAVLVELISALNFEAGGELAERLYALYEFCLRESAIGDLSVVQRILEGLREAWYEGVVMARAA